MRYVLLACMLLAAPTWTSDPGEPLDCSDWVFAAMPTVGDYLTVADTLPDPPPGTGRYYITSVNYQGQIRYGRKNIGGVLSGRDPAVLPACIN